MRIFIATFFFLLISCNENKKSPTVSERKAGIDSSLQSTTDNLDTSNSPYIMSDFPDSVKKVLYQGKDTSWQIVYRSLLPNPKETAFPNQSFIETLQMKEFQIDTTNDKFFAQKRLFNQRQNIQFNRHYPDTLIVSNEQWFQGKKYLLVTAMYNNAYRRPESYR